MGSKIMWWFFCLGIKRNDCARTMGQVSSTSMDLDIVAKTEMNTGYCYMALNGDNQFMRPLASEYGVSSWSDGSLQFGDRCRFVVLKNPPEMSTQYPHKNEDTLVFSLSCTTSSWDDFNLFDRLKEKAVEISQLGLLFPLDDENKYGRYHVPFSGCHQMQWRRLDDVREFWKNTSYNRTLLRLPHQGFGLRRATQRRSRGDRSAGIGKTVEQRRPILPSQMLRPGH